MHLFLRPAEATPEALAAAVEARGAGPLRFERIEPSLEDVFIALVRQGARS
jgi:hypothetical protein